MTLIDKAALLNTIATEVHYDSERPLEMYAKLLSVVNDAPTADSEPVKHGHWGEEWFDHKLKIVCSVCECFADRWTDYCPNCGAKMDEVTNDE